VGQGDVIMSICATIGEPVIVDMDACIHDGFVVFDRFEYSLYGQFLLHLLRKIAPEFKASGQTGTQANLNTGIVSGKVVTIPRDTTEQSHIAAVLDTVDEAIAKTEAVIAKLGQVRAGLLHDLLTHGLDENGQLRDPIAHPEQFEDSPLGRIPCEWRVFALCDVAEKVQDGTHFSPKTTSGPRRYLTSKNIRFGFLDLNDCGWISEAEHQEIFRRCDVRKNDILLTKDGVNTGNASLNTLDEEFSLLSSVALIRCRAGLSHHEFFLNYLLSPTGQKRLKDLMSGNAITRLTLQKIKNFTVPLPPFEEQIWIAERLEECRSSIESTEHEMVKLQQLKSGLMTDLLTGRIRVPESVLAVENQP
jgi:type I restriction enzyme S subunit